MIWERSQNLTLMHPDVLPLLESLTYFTKNKDLALVSLSARIFEYWQGSTIRVRGVRTYVRLSYRHLHLITLTRFPFSSRLQDFPARIKQHRRLRGEKTNTVKLRRHLRSLKLTASDYFDKFKSDT